MFWAGFFSSLYAYILIFLSRENLEKYFGSEICKQNIVFIFNSVC